MSARHTCTLCDSTGLVARPDIFVPGIMVFEACPMGCELLPPDYSDDFCFSVPISWPEWMVARGEPQVEPRPQRTGHGQDDGVRDQT